MKTKCQVWSRVVGYLRPTSKWNDGKVSEFNDRKVFKLKTKSINPRTEALGISTTDTDETTKKS